MTCPRCTHPSPASSRFCTQCGAALTATHPQPATGGMPNAGAAARVEQPEPALPGCLTAELGGVEPLPPGAALLVVTGGPQSGGRFLLTEEVTTVGRHPDSDILLDDVTVSRRHAELHREPGGFAVHDIGSLNGTYVNRQPVHQATLADGDRLQIGKFRLVYLTGSHTPQPAGDAAAARGEQQHHPQPAGRPVAPRPG